MRTFICIDFPEEIIKEVSRIQESLSKYKFTGKTTEPENLHLTLKFLGEIDEERLDKVKEALSRIKFKEFEAKLEKAGTFKIRGNPKITWIKIGGKGIFELQKEIDESIKNLFPLENRFMSHLTIARIKYVKDKKEFEKFIKNIHPKKLSFKISKFYLKKSELKPLGPIYTTIEKYKAI